MTILWSKASNRTESLEAVKVGNEALFSEGHEKRFYFAWALVAPRN